MSLLGAGLAGMVGAGQAYLGRKQRQEHLKNVVDLENYRNQLMVKRLKEQQKLRDQLYNYNLQKHAITEEEATKRKMNEIKINTLKDTCMHGSKTACKELDKLGIHVGEIKYPIGKPKARQGGGTTEKLTAYSTRLSELNRQLKAIRDKYTEETNQNIYKNTPQGRQLAGFKKIKAFNPEKVSPADRKRYADLQKAIYQTMAKMSQLQGLPEVPAPPPTFDESKYILENVGQPKEQYGPSELQLTVAPQDVAKLERAGLTEYDVKDAIRKFRLAHPEAKMTDAELVKRIINGLQ